MTKQKTPTSNEISGSKVVRSSSSGQFTARAERWASANSKTQEAASSKLKDMGIYNNRGKLAKDYK